MVHLTGCRFGLLVLQCAVLGAVALGPSTIANEQLSHSGQLNAGERQVHPTAALRGVHNLAAARHIVALQASASTHLKVGTRKRSHSKRTGRTAVRSHSKLRRLLHSQDKKAKGLETKAHQDTGRCRNKLRWWIKVKKKCAKAYGDDSRWDRHALDGQCADAWKKCNTGFYAVCCTQPLGPKNIKAYCDGKGKGAVPTQASLLQNGTKDEHASHGTDDKACEVQGDMEGVKNTVEGIKNTIKLMDEDDVVEEETVQLAPPPMKPKLRVAPSPGPMVFAAPSAAPPGLQAAPAPAPVVLLGPKEHVPTKLEQRCAKLKELTAEATARIANIKSWAHNDGMRDDDEMLLKHKKPTGPQELEETIDTEIANTKMENPEAKDPDLVLSVKGVLRMGKKLDALMQSGEFCTKGYTDEDDDDDDPVESDLKSDPEDEWVSDEEDEEEDEPEVLKINETAVYDLLNWEGETKNAVTHFEENVHPHGYKWWRYRYEYTVIESCVLAFSCVVLYIVMWLLHGVSFSHVHKFYKTGLPQRFERYAWVYFLFHGCSLMVMVTFSYMLYIPWGKQNIFNIFATGFHQWIDGTSNVPIIGYSWLYMFLDVQFQLFVCFTLYSLFVHMVVENYIKALRDWKSISEEQEVPHSSNLTLYRHLDGVIKRRVRNTPAYKQMFKDAKLRLAGVEGLDVTLPGWTQFQLHLYLTDGLGRSAEYLTEVSRTTNLFLALSALVVAVLAHHFQVAFMYFLPGFVTLGLIIFIAGYCVSLHYRNLADNDNYKEKSKWITLHSFCRAVQIMLYCLFYSFSRLLLSNDIFEFYPIVYLSACIGLVVILLLLYFFAGHVIKETTCALILPPHVPDHLLRQQLEQIVFWHTSEKCHECGAEQLPLHSSISKEWAGKKPVGERTELPALNTTRLYSWRG